ncbi:MAG: hypothetical protein JXP73_03310 [Deltaproteobacteria bacterium]|nr:hypothetical protein [Deltaproteobacteria bacterium]
MVADTDPQAIDKPTADLFEKIATLVDNLLSAEAGEEKGLRQALLQARRDCLESFVHDQGRWNRFVSGWELVRKQSSAHVKEGADLCLWLVKDRFGKSLPCWLDLDSWRDDPERLKALADCYRKLAGLFRGDMWEPGE